MATTATEYETMAGLEYRLDPIGIVGKGKIGEAEEQGGFTVVRRLAVHLDSGGYGVIRYDPPIPWQK